MTDNFSIEVTRSQPVAGWSHRRQLHICLLHNILCIIQQYHPGFLQDMHTQGTPLPDLVREEFEAYIKSGRLEHGFLRVSCEHCQHEHLVAFSCRMRGFCLGRGVRCKAEGLALLADKFLP